MPDPPGQAPTRYRWKKTKSGKKVRLGFRGGKVVETKTKSGKAHRVKR